MIENIRKYRGLIIFALVLVVIALVFGFKEDLFNSGGGDILYRVGVSLPLDH